MVPNRMVWYYRQNSVKNFTSEQKLAEIKCRHTFSDKDFIERDFIIINIATDLQFLPSRRFSPNIPRERARAHLSRRQDDEFCNTSYEGQPAVVSSTKEANIRSHKLHLNFIRSHSVRQTVQENLILGHLTSQVGPEQGEVSVHTFPDECVLAVKSGIRRDREILISFNFYKAQTAATLQPFRPNRLSHPRTRNGTALMVLSGRNHRLAPVQPAAVTILFHSDPRSSPTTWNVQEASACRREDCPNKDISATILVEGFLSFRGVTQRLI
eukprot:108123-Hanusia_phi.AAC.3